MNNITIGQITGAIGTLTVIVGFFVALFKWYKTNFTNKFASIEKRLEKLEETTEKQEFEIKESKEERLILLKGQLACLKGLKEQGCNGSVTTTIATIEDYLIDKSHQ